MMFCQVYMDAQIGPKKLNGSAVLPPYDMKSWVWLSNLSGGNTTMVEVSNPKASSSTAPCSLG